MVHQCLSHSALDSAAGHAALTRPQWEKPSSVASAMLSLPLSVVLHLLYLLCPCLMKTLSPGLTDVMLYTGCDDDLGDGGLHNFEEDGEGALASLQVA